MDLSLLDSEETEKMVNYLRSKKHPVYDGCMFPKFPTLLDGPEQHMEAIRNFDSKETDILLCTFPKSGTNWVYETVSMILQGDSQYTQDTKVNRMMETINLDQLSDQPSPRFINTHVAFRHIPKKHVDNGYKIIHVLRNPKDVMVSLYNHCRNDPCAVCIEEDFPGKWDDFIQDMCENKHNFYGGFFNYEREWEKAKQTKAVTNVHTVFYEDLKKNPVAEVERLAAFLNKELSPQLMEDIADKCSFTKLAEATRSGQKGEDMVAKFSENKTNFIFRKGTVGDWKNWFTVAQNEMFDQLLDRELKDSNLQFTYTL
ncbi:sulfotransferase 1B1-like [Ylistrum balloti]|uniref:sulfotransferase 1B1-like n=1 Tax=Ylistrum balloti TaxID=509963 RepID=UPI002905DAD6|nr:sulfotransferase 1B1-like [Ylistrum balloti]